MCDHLWASGGDREKIAAKLAAKWGFAYSVVVIIYIHWIAASFIIVVCDLKALFFWLHDYSLINKLGNY